MRRLAMLAVITAGACLLVPQSAKAEPPWKKLLPFDRVDADPRVRYEITEENGPWMILAASFAGPGAENQARQLVLELRKRYKLEAYVHAQNYDFSDDVVGLGLDKYGSPKKMKHRKDSKFTEVGVLVGNYTSVDDPRVEKDLNKIKVAHPNALKLDPTKPSTQRFAGLREMHRRVTQGKQELGPMRRAFLARNPLIPKEFFVAPGIDPLILNINKSVEHSLLNNKARYTVKVATFRGDSKFDSEVSEEKPDSWLPSLKRRKPTKLDLAADKAHRLTVALRKRGVPAYEFHDRHESIVTVGGFDSVGAPRGDGKIEINPAIHQVMKAYAADRTSQGTFTSETGRHSGAGVMPKKLEEIQFDIQPVPVMVPQQSVANRLVSHR